MFLNSVNLRPPDNGCLVVYSDVAPAMSFIREELCYVLITIVHGCRLMIRLALIVKKRFSLSDASPV